MALGLGGCQDTPAMSLKKKLQAQGMKLISDPRVMKLMQDERMMKVMMGAMSMPARAQSFAEQQRENLIRALGAASEQEVRDLKRTLRALESELSELRHREDHE